MNPFKDVEDTSFSVSSHLSYEDIATKLLRDHYFLTALELHTELVESGKELPQLREFFSNPGNFEQHVSRATDLSSMHRTPSQATLDSLDTARYSEDGGGDRGGSDGDVAVLEFELRKARETIKALRANLTQFADNESTLDKTSKDKFNQRPLKPHEKRALNFLINEYLLMHDYKLTSITFSDENPDQEFEDWDDVGLNMPRPAGLASLLWGNSSGLSIPKVDACIETECTYTDMSCQTDDEGSVCVPYQPALDSETDWSHELLIQAEEIELLKQKIIALETEKLNFQKLYDAAIVSLNSLTSPISESKTLTLTMSEEKIATSTEVLGQLSDTRPITCSAAENHYGSGNSTHSATPEQFEMIDSDKNSVIRKEGSNSSFDRGTTGGSGSVRDSPLRRSSVTTLDETLSINDVGEWTRIPYECSSIENSSKEMWIDSNVVPNSLKMSILNWCCDPVNANEPLANDLLAELVNSDKAITLPEFLNLAIDTLPRVLAHTLVGRRCEAAAALAAGAALLPAGAPRRAAALHHLLTLVKRPTPQDARVICEATCLVVKWGGSGEVLSSVAELLTSKSPERRLLASQICVSIAPYVPIELCTSLLLSLVVLMCESSETEIRNHGIKAACLICPVADHKYAQIESLMFNALKDSNEKNVKDAVNVFVPVLARSAIVTGKFASDLCPRIISNLSKSSTSDDWKSVILNLEVMQSLVLAKLAYVINVQIVRDYTLDNCDIETVNLQDVPLENEQDFFIDLQCYVAVNVDAKKLLTAMNSLVKERPDVRWTELAWFSNLLKQILEITANSKILSHPTVYEHLISLFNTYVENFNVNVTTYVIRPVFNDMISELEQKMEKLHTISVDNTSVVGVYLVTVLPAVGDKLMEGEFLQKWVVYSSIRCLPVKILAIPLKWVACHKSDKLVFYLQHVKEFAESGTESSSGFAIRLFVANLINELVNSAEINEECLANQLLPTVVSLLHDDDTSVRESALTAWGSVTRACMTRRLALEASCWPPVDGILARDVPLPPREAARLAEAVALLVLPTADNNAISEKAVSVLCECCGRRGDACAEWAVSLTAALQLAQHHCRAHPALLPALRKLEEIAQTVPSVSQYKGAIEALILNVVGPGTNTESAREPPRAASNLAAAQEVGRRVSQMFQQSKTNMNLPNIFKKKT